jgi:hypothetical protein
MKKYQSIGKISTKYLECIAVVYLRQSSEWQVQLNK